MDSQKRKEAYHKSRLGQILVNKGYMSREALDEVIAVQPEESAPLGEMLVERRMLSRWQLRRALSSQTRIRFAASVSVVIMDEVQKLISGNQKINNNSLVHELLRPLLVNQRIASGGAIHYDPTLATAEVLVNGAIRLKQPCSVGEFQFDGLRLNVAPGEGYEKLQLEDVDFSGAELNVRVIYQGINDTGHLDDALCTANRNH